MLSTNKTFRVFVSSTFSDLKAERDALQRFVFPKLRALCRLHGAHFQAIDLRWGVSDDAAHDQRTMNICLEEIGRCQRTTPRPNFVILLGDRYGWRPVPDEIPNCYFEKICNQLKERAGADELALLHEWYDLDDNALPPLRWLKPRDEKHSDPKVWEQIEQALLAIFQEACTGLSLDSVEILKFGASATEQEIARGVLLKEGAAKDAHCFLRAVRNLEPGPGAEAFQDCEVSAGLRLKRLKAQLRRCLPQTNIHEYLADWTGKGITTDHLGPVAEDNERGAESLQSTIAPRTTQPNFCQDFYDSLASIVRCELKPVKADLLDQEIKYHKDFGQSRADEKLFTGRTEALEKIGAYLRTGNAAPLAVCGASGSGKSTVMARAAAVAKGEHPQAKIICRFIGVTPESTQGPALLESLCRQISRVYEMERPVPTEYLELSKHFKDQLAKIPADKPPLFIFLDALDQLSDLNNARSLSWLPIELQPQVRLVVSTLLDSQCLTVLESQLAEEDFLQLGEMPEQEGSDLLTRLFSQAERTLQFPQRAKVLEGFKHSPLPLYLKLAFEEARRWRSGDVPRDLENDIPGLIEGLFERLSGPANHGRSLISASLAFLAAAKNGLTEDEMIDVLSEDTWVMEEFRRRFPKSPKADRLPAVIWSRLFYDLENYLSERGADGTSLLAFFHRQFSEAVAKAYLDEATELRRHWALAKYFAQQQLQFDSANMRSLNLRKLSELPYQLRKARMPDELENTLCDLSFIEAKCAAGMIYELIADYNAALTSADLTPSQRKRISEFARFIRAQSHVLARHPELAFQQALNEPDTTAPADAARGRLTFPEESRRRLRWINKPRFPSPCQFTLVGHEGEVNDVSLDGQRIVSASSDHQLKIWETASGNERLVLRGHKDSVETCAFSPDGKRIVSADRSGYIKLWDALSGNELKHIPFAKHENAVATCIFSPDGKNIISASWDRTLKVWNAHTGEELHSLRGHVAECVACGFSPNGSLMVSGAVGGVLKLWDTTTWEELKSLQAHDFGIWKCGFSPDGKSILTASEDGTLKRWSWDGRDFHLLTTYRGHEMHVWTFAIAQNGTTMVSGAKDKTIRVWDVASGKQLSILRGHDSDILSLSFVPKDESRLVSGSWDSTLKIWDMAAVAEPIVEPVQTGSSEQSPHGQSDTLSVQGPLLSCSRSPDGKFFVAGTFDGRLLLWDAKTGSDLGSFELHPKDDYVVGCPFSPDSKWILAAGWNGPLKLFNLQDKKDGPPLPRHESQILACGFSSDGKRIFSCSADQIVVWDFSPAGAEPRRQWSKGREHWQTCVISPDGNWVIAGTADGTLGLRDVASGQEKSFASGHAGLRYSALSSDGARFATVSDDGTLKVWDVASRAELITLEAHTNKVQSCSFSADGRRIASASYDRTVKVWELANPTKSITMLGHTELLQDVCFSVDGTKVLSVAMDGTFRLWDAETGLPLGRLVSPVEIVNACVFSGDGTRLASASHFGAAKLWDASNGAEQHMLKGHAAEVLALAFSSDGQKILSASADRSLRLWDATTGRQLRVLSGHGGPVAACDISADRKTIVSASWDGTLKLWDMESGTERATLTGHTNWVQQVLFISGGKRIISCSLDKTIRIWETASGTLESILDDHQTFIGGCGVSRDGSLLVSGTGGGTLRIWDLQTGQQKFRLTGHTGPIRSCVFSPDGLKILSASMDKTLRLWDAKSGELRFILNGHEGEVLTCAWSHDGSNALSGSEDFFVKIWDTGTGKEICKYWAGARVQTVCQHDTTHRIAVGDALGRIHLLELEGSPTVV
jgi:WD40 repeat protein